MRSRGTPPRARRTYALVVLAAAAIAVALLVPTMAGAAGSNVGAGEANGTVSFSSVAPYQPLPPVTQPGCVQTHFTLSGQSQAMFALNSTINGFVGQLNLSGSGGSTCEMTSSGSGQLTLSASSIGSTFLSCNNLTGSYTRVGTNVSAQLGGICTINKANVSVTLIFEGEFVPDDVANGAGTSKPITSATFDGAFVLAPN